MAKILDAGIHIQELAGLMLAVRVDGTLPPERRNQRSPEESRATPDLTEPEYYAGPRLPNFTVASSTGRLCNQRNNNNDMKYRLGILGDNKDL
jgi:hypothetical protein